MCIRNTAHCHSNSLTRLSNSILRCVASRLPKSTILASCQLRRHLVLISLRYGNVQATWNVSTTVHVTPSNRKMPHLEASEAPLQTFLHVAVGKKPFVFSFFFPSWSSKTAERRLTCFLMKHFLSYHRCSWFLSMFSGLIRRLQRRGRLLLYNWESHLWWWFVSPARQLVRSVCTGGPEILLSELWRVLLFLQKENVFVGLKPIKITLDTFWNSQ